MPALVRLLKLLLPIFGAAATKDLAQIFNALPLALNDKDITFYSEMFGPYSWYLDGDKWVPLIRKPQAFLALHFAGRYLEFLKWLTFNVEVNYGPFFSGAMIGLDVN